jgi:hypothetical protein
MRMESGPPSLREPLPNRALARIISSEAPIAKPWPKRLSVIRSAIRNRWRNMNRLVTRFTPVKLSKQAPGTTYDDDTGSGNCRAQYESHGVRAIRGMVRVAQKHHGRDATELAERSLDVDDGAALARRQPPKRGDTDQLDRN